MWRDVALKRRQIVFPQRLRIITPLVICKRRRSVGSGPELSISDRFKPNGSVCYG